MKRALVLSLICVLGVAFSGLAATSLSGYWDTDVTIDPQQTNFNDAITLTSEIAVDYMVGAFTFGSITTLTEAGWADQTFSVAGVLGAFTLGSSLDFDPTAPAFEEWITTVSVSIAGVSFGSTFTLIPQDVTLELTAGGVAGDVTVNVTVTFGHLGVEIADGCDLDWQSILIDLGFPFCCADITAAIAFDCDGFDYASFAVGGIAIPNLPWLTLGAEIIFTVDEKTLDFTPTFAFGDIVCFDLDISVTSTHLVGDPLEITGIVIDRIGLTCDIGAVTFTGVSDFSPEGIYWEWYTLSTNDEACCGPFGFELGFYFLENGLALFDLGLIDVDMTLQVASQFTFNMGLEVNVDSGAFTQWLIGFLVTW